MIKKKWGLKIGGSLSPDHADPSILQSLCSVIGALSLNFEFLVIPGGGLFADFIRDRSAKLAIAGPVSHIQAILAMAQYGHELVGMIENGIVAHNSNEVNASWEKGKIPVFIPYPSVVNDAGIPQNWGATSDTIAAKVCQSLGINRLVLLKSVDGIRLDGKLLKEVDARSAPPTDVVDSVFMTSVEKGFTACIINGRKPERLKELLQKGSTVGTKILG